MSEASKTAPCDRCGKRRKLAAIRSILSIMFLCSDCLCLNASPPRLSLSAGICLRRQGKARAVKNTEREVLQFTSSEQRAELRELEAAATPGRWGIYTETVDTPAKAVAEVAELVAGTPKFAGKVVMLNAIVDGKYLAPAITGCGERSAENASLIAVSRNLLVPLLNDVDRLTAALERITQAHDDGAPASVLHEIAHAALRLSPPRREGERP